MRINIGIACINMNLIMEHWLEMEKDLRNKKSMFKPKLEWYGIN